MEHHDTVAAFEGIPPHKRRKLRSGAILMNASFKESVDYNRLKNTLETYWS
jgi:hypothetical protein